MPWFRAVLLAVLATGLLAGCSAGSGTPVGDAPTASIDVPSPTPPPPPTPSPSPQAGEEPVFADCPVDVEAGIDATVTAQLDAFAAGDFRTAFGYASESFRSSVDLKGFRRIIREGYPEVASARSHVVVDCRQLAPGDAQALVSVTGQGGSVAQVGYRFVLESGGWRIDGASTLDTLQPQVA
jgi:hypothetical protein